LWEDFLALNPAVMTRTELHFPRQTYRFELSQPCWGMSRYVLDEFLKSRVLDAGAEWLTSLPESQDKRIVAHGRKDKVKKGQRQFGFKAHHAGAASSSIELYFFRGCYVGVNPVEGGITNVCGLGPEEVLREVRFDYDALCRQCPALGKRLGRLDRQMDWLSTGPLVYRFAGAEKPVANVYPAGDALGFVDPYTGTGMLNALISGALAGACAAEGKSPEEYLRRCRQSFRRAFAVSTIFRKLVQHNLADVAPSPLAGNWLFQLTRPVVPTPI
jgi:hypothetical protein